MISTPISLSTKTEQSRARVSLRLGIEAARKSELLGRVDAPEWDDLTWNLDGLTSRSGPASPACTILIGQIGAIGTRRSAKGKPYNSVWGDLLKSLLIWRLEDSADEGLKLKGGTLAAFSTAVRHLIDHFILNSSASDITMVTKKEVEEFFAQISHRPKFRQAKLAIKMLTDRGIAPQLLGMSLQLPREHQEKHLEAIRPTTWNEIVALGEAFNRLQAKNSEFAARRDFDYLRYYTMMAVLLTCAPGRVSELWRLAADTAVISAPVERLGDQIPPEKKGGA